MNTHQMYIMHILSNDFKKYTTVLLFFKKDDACFFELAKELFSKLIF